MPDKKFKLSRKQGLYAVAGAALIGSLAAAAITAPDILHSVFDPDKYNFSNVRMNGDVAYNAADGVGSSAGGEDSGAGGLLNDNGETFSDAPEQENSAEETQDEHADAKQDSSESTPEPSKESGIGKDSFALVDMGMVTDKASSEDSTGGDLGEDAETQVEVGKDDGTIDSVIPEYTPAPTRVPATPAPTKAPVITPRPAPTLKPTFETSSSGNSRPSATAAPEVTNAPTAEPVVTQAPSATEMPVVTQAPQATREPMPTEAPEPQKPADIVKDNEAAGNEVEVSKGEIGITNHTGSSGSVTSGGATRIDFTKFTGDQSSVEYIQISSSIKNIDFETAKVLFPNLKGFVVNKNNKYYQSIDGVLYSKDGKTLYACPAQVTEITEFPEGLETIHAGAFLGSSMESITLPETVTSVGENAFAEASMGTVTFTAEIVNLGATAFFNSSDDGLSVKKLVFTSKIPPTVDDNTALKFKNPHTGLDTSGMVIEVPDSENDSVLREYMKAWGETIDGIYGSGMTSYLFNTAEGAGKDYSYENKALYRKAQENGGFELLYVAPSTEGEFTPLYDTQSIGADAFKGCDKITAINIPSTITSLEEGCFKGLDKLTSIVVAGMEPMETNAAIWQDINPDEVKIYVYPDALDAYMDSWGKVLDELFGEGSAQKIINGAAADYTYIDGALYAVTEEGKMLVDAPHTNLDNFALAEGTIKINDGAFGSKYTYNYVLIPNTVTEIAENAFASASIEVLVMTSAEPVALGDAEGIKQVYVPSEALEAYKSAWGESLDISAPALNYVADSHAIYGVDVDDNYTLYDLATTYQGTFTMLDKVKEIRERALYDCTGVEEINFSVITEKIGEESFANNTSLKSVDMVKMTALTEIPERAFYNCTSMADMQLPLLITKIGESAAENCTSLITVNFNKLSKLEEIGDRAFYNNTSLDNVALSSARSLVSVGESVFENCTGITTVRMPLNLEKMGDKMFKNASSLGRIAFASNLKEIGVEALYGTALETMNISSLIDLETIGEGAFAECSNLREITLPEKVAKISARMAENDTSLMKVVMSEKTTEIGEAAFRGCSLLEEIIIPAAVEKIEKDAFAGCDSLKKITVESEIPAQLGENAFGDELDDMKIYVPLNTYGIYVAAWDTALYNRAAEIIVEVTPEPGETEEPEATPEPGETEEPGATPEPGETEEPETTPEPGKTEEPETTPEPGETEEPEATPEPGEPEEPGETEEPEATPEPGETEEPEATPEPGETEGSETTPEPGETEDPEATPESGETEDPEATPEPGETEEPESTDDSDE